MPEDLATFLEALRGLQDDSATQEAWLRVRDLAHRHLPESDRLRAYMTTQDLAQEVYLDLAHAVTEFRGASWEEFLGFARVVVDRRKVQAARKEGAQKRGGLDRDERLATSFDAQGPRRPVSIAQAKEHYEWVQRRIEELPEHEKEALQLRIDGMDYAQISEQLGISPEAARKRVSRALQSLKEEP